MVEVNCGSFLVNKRMIAKDETWRKLLRYISIESVRSSTFPFSFEGSLDNP
jgi:hypothetical protein